jgi:hypothetical protein
MTSLKKQNLKFSDYATKSIQELFSKDIIDNSLVKKITTFSSFIAYNNGKGNFTIKELPSEAQFSCICEIKCEDINKDGITDLILGGNNFNFKPQFSRLDAIKGLILFGNNNGDFSKQTKTGFNVEGEIKEMQWIKNASGKRFLIVAINDKQPKIFGIDD